MARIENTNQLVMLDSLREWLQRTGAALRVQPIIDIEATLHSTRYEVRPRCGESPWHRQPL